MFPSFLSSAAVSVSALGLLMVAPAIAAGPLEVTAHILVEAKQRATDGTTRVALVPATRVVPGDRVVFQLAYRNTGRQPLADIVLDNPVPAAIAYRAPAEGSAAPELTVDGRRWGPLATLDVALPGGGTRAATAADVTRVRWRLGAPLAPGAAGRLAFQAVLK
ncbi:hypothetical protein Q5H91_09045 [Sphingomonas sp. KR1UV-12]|uniref:Repeat protein (TIGR01451 family) n=1 Tax=Sphingomonas aurea TaxID=3063994 RepID=A0ABT9EKP4_9SPHN|nr:hypothetical protein [Sphingomonas sp. KR1UV-12]MDP1027358.1 hypothetical protein [Sphingomonas sp. KR1UV-12]